VSPEQAKKDVIKGHADRLANEMTMEQIYDENLDPKMMTVAEYLAKWDKLSYNRKQHIVNHLKWECDLSDEIANLGTTSDMQIADDNEMFYQNFHGRDKEKHIIDREFQLQLMLEWRSGGMNKIQQEIVDQTLEPVLKALTKNNLKLAKKLAEYYDKPTSKGLKNINPESLIRLFRTPSALKTLAKRFAIEVPDEISETIELASYIISRA
jgi:hypothetical protein